MEGESANQLSFKVHALVTDYIGRIDNDEDQVVLVVLMDEHHSHEVP